jgi:hypothetical protein
VIVDTNNRTIIEEPDIWSSSVAFAYPAACPNDDGVVGLGLFFGGGGSHPAHAVGFRDGGAWVLSATGVSTHAPPGAAWGDYLTCRRHEPSGAEWVASGFTLQGGSDRRFVQPRYVHFGMR